MTNFSYELKAWKNPTSGQERIYVNGGLLDRADKLFIFAAKDPLIGKPSWDARISNAAGLSHLVHRGAGTSAMDIAATLASKALAERGLENKSFAEILEAVK